MLAFLAITFAALAVGASAPAVPTSETQHAGILVGESKPENTEARLVERDESVRFEISGPPAILPQIAVDVDRNGKIDADLDFMVSVLPDGSPCLTRLMGEGKSSTCSPPGEKAQVSRVKRGQIAVTHFSFPKKSVSADGFGFGFVINLWNETTKARSGLASADYRFNGFLQHVSGGPNFMGGGIEVPAEVMPAIQHYQSCLTRSTDSLVPLDRSKLGKLKAVLAACAKERDQAESRAVDALVKSGSQKSKSEAAVAGLLEQIDKSFSRLIDALENTP